MEDFGWILNDRQWSNRDREGEIQTALFHLLRDWGPGEPSWHKWSLGHWAIQACTGGAMERLQVMENYWLANLEGSLKPLDFMIIWQPALFQLGGDKFTDCREVVQWSIRHLLLRRVTFSTLIKIGEAGKKLLRVAEVLSELAPTFQRAVKTNS
jgi:hypothetical protein